MLSVTRVWEIRSVLLDRIETGGNWLDWPLLALIGGNINIASNFWRVQIDAS